MEEKQLRFADEIDACIIEAKGLTAVLLALVEADSDVSDALPLAYWESTRILERLERTRELGLEACRA